MSEEDIRTVEALDTVDLLASPDQGFDTGFGDMDVGGGDFNLLLRKEHYNIPALTTVYISNIITS